MKRRNFIRNASLTGFGIAVGSSILACDEKYTKKSGEEKALIPSSKATLPLVIATWDVKNATAKAWEILQAGGYVSVNTGGVPDGNAIPVSKETSSLAMDAAACIGCGACVAACKNASAVLFVSAKVSQYALLPQGQPERIMRVEKMVKVMDELGFGSCTNTYACEAECPKGISVRNIARMNREFVMANVKSKEVEV